MNDGPFSMSALSSPFGTLPGLHPLCPHFLSFMTCIHPLPSLKSNHALSTTSCFTLSVTNVKKNLYSLLSTKLRPLGYGIVTPLPCKLCQYSTFDSTLSLWNANPNPPKAYLPFNTQPSVL